MIDAYEFETWVIVECSEPECGVVSRTQGRVRIDDGVCKAYAYNIPDGWDRNSVLCPNCYKDPSEEAMVGLVEETRRLGLYEHE